MNFTPKSPSTVYQSPSGIIPRNDITRFLRAVAQASLPAVSRASGLPRRRGRLEARDTAGGDACATKTARSLAGWHFIFSLCVLLCVATLRAEEQTTTVRVIGISDPSRVEDFRTAVKSVAELQLVSVDGDKATAVLRYDVSALITKPKPKPADLAPAKILEQIDNLIGKASVRTFSVTGPTGIAEDKLTKVEFKVGLLDCKGCRYGAYIAIAKIEGVERAAVDSITRTLTAWIDPAKTNKEALEAALKKARVELP